MNFICGGLPSMTPVDTLMNDVHVEMESVLAWNNALDARIDNLAAEMEKLSLQNNTIRSELGRNGGHKGKVNSKVLLWLDLSDRIKRQFTHICHSYISLVKLDKFVRISSFSLVVVFASSETYDRYKSLAEQNLRTKMIRDKIMEYLDDPMIRAICFLGVEGWFKRKIIKEITDELPQFTRKIVSSNLFEEMSLMTLQHHIATQVQIRANLEVNNCLFLFDDERTAKPEVNIRNDWKVVSIVSCMVNHTLRGMYHRHQIYKQILNLSHEVKLLEDNYSSLQISYHEDGVDAVPGGFTTHKTLRGKSAQEVSSSIWEYLLDPIIGGIGLYGVGGVGKTTIVKRICTELANTDIFDRIIWVSLSKTEMDKGNYIRLQDEIAMQLGIKLLGHENLWERASRISEKLKIVGKCLFILDDVWQTVSLKTIGIPLPFIAYDCKVLLTSRSDKVCMNMGVDKKINLAPLSDEEAWNLFVSISGDQVLHPEIRTIAKQIVHECGGLPITIITASHAMKDEVNIPAWNQALKDLQGSHSILREEGMDYMFDVLFFGYNHLMNDQVRGCFLCCAIFPEDYKFGSRELVRYWMAENLINNEKGIVESINDGLEIVKKLIGANMLEIFTEGGIEWLKMHDMFRDLAIIIMRVKLDFIVKAGDGVNKFPFTSNAKISLIRNQISDLRPFYSTCTNTLTLLLRENPLRSISCSFFSIVPNLQVLDMSYSGVKQLPKSFSELHKLRVLFLDFCTWLEKLPSFEKLKDLRFLNLRGTLIKELPHGIEGLINLRSLDLSETKRLKHIKAGVISSLSNLEELQLQGSRLCKMESPEVANVFEEIRCLKQLGILTLSAVGFGDHLDMILHLQQYNLKSFSVNAYGSALDYMDDM